MELLDAAQIYDCLLERSPCGCVTDGFFGPLTYGNPSYDLIALFLDFVETSSLTEGQQRQLLAVEKNWAHFTPLEQLAGTSNFSRHLINIFRRILGYFTEAEQLAIFEYIETYYNRKRIHSANDYLSPVEFEAARRAA